MKFRFLLVVDFFRLPTVYNWDLSETDRLMFRGCL